MHCVWCHCRVEYYDTVCAKIVYGEPSLVYKVGTNSTIPFVMLFFAYISIYNVSIFFIVYIDEILLECVQLF